MAKDEIKTRAERAARRKAQLDGNIFSRLAAASATSRAHAQKCLKQNVELTVVEWRVLWDLIEAGPLSVREMAAIQRCDSSLVSRALPQMQSKGYVTLAQDLIDKRQTLVTLTDDGRAAYHSASPLMKKRRANLKGAFSPEETARFLDYIERLEACLEAHEG